MLLLRASCVRGGFVARERAPPAVSPELGKLPRLAVIMRSSICDARKGLGGLVCCCCWEGVGRTSGGDFLLGDCRITDVGTEVGTGLAVDTVVGTVAAGVEGVEGCGTGVMVSAGVDCTTGVGAAVEEGGMMMTLLSSDGLGSLRGPMAAGEGVGLRAFTVR